MTENLAYFSMQKMLVFLSISLFSATGITTPTTTTSATGQSKSLSVFAKILAFAWLRTIFASAISEWFECLQYVYSLSDI